MKTLQKLIIACTLTLSVSASFASDENTGTGTVAETMTSGGYVYVRLTADDSWVASTPIPVSVGDKIKYTGGSTMKDFHSRTLNRTFDYILFAMNLQVVNDVNADAHSTAVTNDPHAVARTVSAVAPQPGEIPALKNGKTIAEIFTEHEKMEGQQIALRAIVMKFSPDILGKNWVTLQDGTGTAPDNKLLVTSLEEVAIGELVTVNGEVRNNVDLGSGYKYTVVLEKATFSK